MAFSPAYRARIEEQLSAVAPIRTRAMFGGVGIYSEECFFALIAEDKLHFRVGQINAQDFDELDMPYFFPYEAPKPMPYRELPAEVLEDPAKLGTWIEKAVSVARDAKKPSRNAKTH